MDSLELNHQFLVSPDRSQPPTGWDEYQVSEVFVHTHPLLPVALILDTDGVKVGVILGWAITEGGELVDATQHWAITSRNADGDAIEDLIYRHGGRFLIVITTPTVNRIYLDPGGTLSMVYAKNRKVAGSTVTALALNNPDHSVWHERPALAPEQRRDQFLPGGLTVDPDIAQLLPNHYLDLKSWQPARHWPTCPTKPVPRVGLADSNARAANVLGRQIRAFAKTDAPLYVTLTAGADTRLMLASAKDIAHRIEFITFNKQSNAQQSIGNLIDLEIATEMARRLGLNHRILTVDRITAELKTEYACRIGFSGNAGKASFFRSAAQRHLNMNGTFLLGHAGTVRWGYYWRGLASDRERLSASKLLIRMGLPRNDRSIQAMTIWLETFPRLPTTTILDYLYIEQRLGCWAAPHYYGMAPFAAVLSPFVHRELFSIAHSLNRTASQRGLLPGVASAVWPELLEFPVNRSTINADWSIRSRRAYQTFKNMIGKFKRRL